MKVLVIVTSSFGFDGISNVVRNYYNYQNHNNIHTDIVTINEIDEQFKRDVDRNKSRNYVLNCRNSNPIKYISKLRRIISSNQYDIVHVHGNSSTMLIEMIAAKFSKCKIKIVHNHNTMCNYRTLNKLLKPFLSKAYDYAFSCGEDAGKWLFGSKPFLVINNGIDLDRYSYNQAKRMEVRNKYNIDNKFVIGHVGRFSLQKNHQKIVEIFKELLKELPESYLVLIGDGELKSEIEEQLKDIKENVLFVGNSPEVHSWLQAIDVVLFPSIFEGLPVFLLEAQAAGLPCIISESITRQINITNSVKFVSLSETAKREWIDQITENKDVKDQRKKEKLIIKDKIKGAGFDIKVNCLELESMYKKMINNN